MTSAASLHSKSRLFSTWTPLNNEEANAKVYEERRNLLGRWFDKWGDSQRKKIISDILEKSTLKQLEYVDGIVKTKVPVYKQDPTSVLPRIISLYIFAHLDPRSLCRCAQVSWHWKFLTELDQIWMPKCARLGWLLTFTPGPFEQGLWKRNYIENIQSLRCLRPAPMPPAPSKDMEALLLASPQASARSQQSGSVSLHSDFADSQLSDTLTAAYYGSSGKKPPAVSKRWQAPPWRGSDPTPKDTWRYNYLDNDDQVEIIKALRHKGLSGPTSEEISLAAKSKVKTGKNLLNTKLTRRSKSLLRLETPEGTPLPPADDLAVPPSHAATPPPERPLWAQSNSTRLEERMQSGEFNASLRPQPVRNVRTAYRAWPEPNRAVRELPSSADLSAFTHKPWMLPTQDTDSDA